MEGAEGLSFGWPGQCDRPYIKERIYGELEIFLLSLMRLSLHMLEFLSNSLPLIIVVLGLFILFYTSFRSSSHHLPPGPPGHWLFGNSIPLQQYVPNLFPLTSCSPCFIAPTDNSRTGLNNMDQSFLYDAVDKS